jgi:hypothetical protein
MKMFRTVTKITGVFVWLALLLASQDLMAQERYVAPQFGAPQIASPADPGNVITPYRYNPAPKQLSPSQDQQALEYQQQLQSQEQNLEQGQAQSSSNPFQRQQLMDTQNELNRVYNVLHP